MYKNLTPTRNSQILVRNKTIFFEPVRAIKLKKNTQKNKHTLQHQKLRGLTTFLHPQEAIGRKYYNKEITMVGLKILLSKPKPQVPSSKLSLKE